MREPDGGLARAGEREWRGDDDDDDDDDRPEKMESAVSRVAIASGLERRRKRIRSEIGRAHV